MASIPRRAMTTAASGLPKPSQRFSPFKELGSSGVAVFGGRPISREKDVRVSGQQRWITYADLVANTSIVAAGVRYFLNIVAHADWTVKPAETKMQQSKRLGFAREEEEEEDTVETGEDVEPKKSPFGGLQKATPPPKRPGQLSGESEPETDRAAEEAAELVDSVINSMETPWRRVMRRAAMYRFMGFGIQEWTAKRRELDGKIGLEDIESRPQHTIDRWEVDEKGTVTGAWQRTVQTSELVFLPRKKILYLVEDSLTDNPEGLGLYRHLVDPYLRLKKYQTLEGWGFERDLRGIPIGRIPYRAMQQWIAAGTMTQEEANRQIAALESFVKIQTKQEDTSLVLDSAPYVTETEGGKSISGVMQYDLQLLQGSSPDFNANANAISRLNQEMARVIGVEHLMLGGEGAANRALSEDKSRNFYLTVNGTLDEIVDGADKDIVAAICDLNGIAEEHRPKLQHSDVSFRSVQEVTAALRDMATAGAVLDPNDPAINDIREMLGLPPAPEQTPEMIAALHPSPFQQVDEDGNPIEAKPNGKQPPPFGKKPNPFGKKPKPDEATT